MILQMQSMTPDTAGFNFNPVVQVSTTTTVAQLEMCGVVNCIDTNHIMSRCLAMVGMNEVAHWVLSDLLGAGGNSLHIQDLNDYLAEGETLPLYISFAEATAMVNSAAQQVLIGWSSEIVSSKRSWRELPCHDTPAAGSSDLLRQWTINPKEKLRARPWRDHDRIVVIKLTPQASGERVTDETRTLRRQTICHNRTSHAGRCVLKEGNI